MKNNLKKESIFLLSLLQITIFLAIFWTFHFINWPEDWLMAQTDESGRVVLESPKMDMEFDLAKGVDLSFWENITGKEIALSPQIIVPPWTRSTISNVLVKSFHNQNDIYFYLEWMDNTRDNNIDINRFSDACAIMFPIGDNIQPAALQTIIQMGSTTGRVNVWHWKATQDILYWNNQTDRISGAYTDYYYPFDEEEILSVARIQIDKPVTDLVAEGVATTVKKRNQSIDGRGIHSDTQWRVVMKRAIQPTEPELDGSIHSNGTYAAFAVWDGAIGDIGGRKSISDWVELKLIDSTDEIKLVKSNGK